ncbi:mitochondrial protein [Phytophthora palmivora]|uniref:Mitochondrial protein n=1 Tax=Phytophthora palmivora TaxID=4796 RepID=A0A2P4YPN3_9STRA|nr:mitochondrial protein [Phytophthora palmivora]
MSTNQVTRTTIQASPAVLHCALYVVLTNVVNVLLFAQLYRDCLRLAKHIGGNSKKGQAIKELVRREFEKGRSETDPEKIEALKANAVRGLSNYLMLANSSKDQRLHDAMNKKSKDDGPEQAEYRDL